MCIYALFKSARQTGKDSRASIGGATSFEKGMPVGNNIFNFFGEVVIKTKKSVQVEMGTNGQMHGVFVGFFVATRQLTSTNALLLMHFARSMGKATQHRRAHQPKHSPEQLAQQLRVHPH